MIARRSLWHVAILSVLVFMFAHGVGNMDGRWGGASAAEKRVVVASGVDLDSLDPQMVNSIIETSVWMHLFESLTWLDFESGELLPQLATSWEQLDDITWEFTLREGVVFHNGAPFTAEAVKYSVERYHDPLVGATGRFTDDAPIDRVEVVDDYTVRIITDGPVPLLIDHLRWLWILEPGTYSEYSNAEAARQPVGTGPYKLDHWRRDEELSISVFGDHWQERPEIDTIVWRPIPETATRLAELQSGGIDLAVNVPSEQARRIEANRSLRLETVQGGRNIFIGLNTTYEYLQDKRVRQALNHAVDVEGIVEFLLGGFGSRFASVANPPNEHPDLQPYAYDPDKARALLEEAGVPEGWTLELSSPSGRYMRDLEVSQAVAADLARVGINVSVQAKEWSVFSGELAEERTSPMYFLGLGGFFNGQGELLWVHPDLPIDGTFWHNEEFLAGYEQLLTEPDFEVRDQLVRGLQEIAFDEAPWIFLYKQYDIYGVSDRLPDWKPRPDEFLIFFDPGLAQ